MQSAEKDGVNYQMELKQQPERKMQPVKTEVA
jgi:hypothetical protein